MKEWYEVWPERATATKQVKRGLSQEEKTEVYVYRAKQVHGDKYEYSKYVYIGPHEKSEIICPQHGSFFQSTSSHLAQGAGCPRCAGKGRTTEQFIEELTSVHGELYDYSKVVFTTVNAKIKIICKVHGEFEQLASGHLSGKGCAKCGGTSKSDTDSFISKATEVHGNRYDYSNSIYTLATNPITIICNIHGSFSQQASVHLSGCGCPKCGKSSTTESFIEKARQIHGDKYGYSSTEYSHSDTKVKITCKIHGDFLQAPRNHLAGQGCAKCAGVAKLDTETFISNAKKVHGDKYDYSKVEYCSGTDKVVITCREHGEFLQNPHNHVASKQGCPSCSKDPSTHLYLLDYGKGIYKIGITNDINSRLYMLNRAYEFGIVSLIKCVRTDNPRAIESLLLAKYAHKPELDRKFDGYSELRILTPTEVEEICLYLETI